METLCVIPARLASTRLPRKLLRAIEGKPLLEYVYENAKKAKQVDQVLVACDHPEIKSCVESFGGEAVLTAAHHQSGTERIAEVAKQRPCEFVVNLQGDEPLMHPAVMDQVVVALKRDRSCQMSTACVPKESADEFLNPNVVKVVKDQNGWAIYFSRSPIPHDRQGRGSKFFKHLGIYGYRRDFLLRFPTLPASHLEECEKLEQLRVLENGYRIKVVETVHDSIGVDTEEDFKRVREKLVSGSRSQTEVPHA
ncbi:MAG: 3-deoxy-manno-octulosonate cytidylyltransferase [Candidatus Omnitrophica bacterium]|nr:3-deoxy-manno-octulosonate cytidylyltransferase [Candidatus Omnitrophota bacterium]